MAIGNVHLRCILTLLTFCVHRVTSFEFISYETNVHLARLGGEVLLQCKVDSQNSAADLMVYWSRGNLCAAPFISINEQLLMDRYRLSKRVAHDASLDYYSIVISNLTVDDEGNYTCAVQPSQSESISVQHFSVQLIEPPKVFLDVWIESNNVVKVPAHTDTQIKCWASGLPIPEVKWSQPKGEQDRDRYNILPYNKATLTQLQQQRNVSILLLRRVNATLDGSKFECVANNSAGVAQHRIEISVEVPPRLKGATEASVHTAMGNVESLKCIIEGNPTPEIQWQYWSDQNRSFLPIIMSNSPRKYNQAMRDRGLFVFEYTLCIFNIQLEDTRLYRCLVVDSTSNTSTNHKVFNLTFAPSPPVVRIDSTFVFADACNISWYAIATKVTHSILELRALRSASEDGDAIKWQSVEVKQCNTRQAPRVGQTTAKPHLSMRNHQYARNFTGAHIFSRLSPNTSYEIRLTACNALYCSGLSKRVVFHTKDGNQIAPSWFFDLKQLQNDVDVAEALKSVASMVKFNLLIVVASVCFHSVWPLGLCNSV